ncbi:hypothetical protein NPS70_01250 [Streptomyces sp. C10-9-1]|uniref:hypothetical protein n=1 Tax=Streptomyces sp. C10-9-1 TaxID=1859285 RepID=UPI0021132E5B|nr:hypothetical protein [Streptomyces sp. C10-9-1]MCQ6551833.1 hypothetical protein [Streptomyces sp. C10-9-1]
MADEQPDEPRASYSDEEWKAFQIESEGPARLRAPKEPSARSRIVAGRLRRRDEEAARRRGPGRLRRRRRGRAEPEGWRAWSAPERAPVRRGGVWTFIWIAVALGFVLALLFPEQVLPFLR